MQCGTREPFCCSALPCACTKKPSHLHFEVGSALPSQPHHFLQFSPVFSYTAYLTRFQVVDSTMQPISQIGPRSTSDNLDIWIAQYLEQRVKYQELLRQTCHQSPSQAISSSQLTSRFLSRRRKLYQGRPLTKRRQLHQRSPRQLRRHSLPAVLS